MINPEPWVARAQPGPRATPYPITPEQCEAVGAAIRPATTEVRVARRGQALLLLAAGVGAEDVAMLVGVHVRTVFSWKKRFRNADDPTALLADAPRSGRRPSLSRTPTPPASKAKRAGSPKT
jgi:hypothetical protein